MPKIPEENKHERKSEMFDLIAKIALKLRKNKPISDTIFYFTVRDRWTVAINGYKESAIEPITRIEMPKKRRIQPRNCMPKDVSSLSAAIWCDGLFVGWCNPKTIIFMEEKLDRNPDTKFDAEDFERILRDELSKP